MIFPAITAGYAALLGVVFFALSLWVVMGRTRHDVLHADGGIDSLGRRIRAHANFAEYVPFILLLTALLEAAGAHRATVHALLLILVAARVLHPIGMVAAEGSIQQYAGRAVGALATFAVLLTCSVLLLVRVL